MCSQPEREADLSRPSAPSCGPTARPEEAIAFYAAARCGLSGASRMAKRSHRVV